MTRAGNNVILGGDRYPVHVWWDENTQAIHLTCNDPALVDENGEKPGFRTVFNTNPRSADYNPGVFNRLSRYLRAQGKPAPEEAPLMPRHLPKRPQVIAELTAAPARQQGQPADPTALGWATCPTCTAIVVDFDKHQFVSTAC
jgi:hypothetical protein